MEDTYSQYRIFDPMGLYDDSYDASTHPSGTCFHDMLRSDAPSAILYDPIKYDTAQSIPLSTKQEAYPPPYPSYDTTGIDDPLTGFDGMYPFEDSQPPYLQYLKNCSPVHAEESAALLDHTTQQKPFDWSTLGLQYQIPGGDYDPKLYGDTWLMDPIDTFSNPANHFDQSSSFANQWVGHPDQPHQDPSLQSNGGLSRSFDVNSFVADVDSNKNSTSMYNSSYSSPPESLRPLLDGALSPSTPANGYSCLSSAYSVPASLLYSSIIQRSQSSYSDSNDESLEELSDSDTTASTQSWMPLSDPLSSWREQLRPPSSSPSSSTGIRSVMKNKKSEASKKKSVRKRSKRREPKQLETMSGVGRRAALSRYQSSPSALSSLVSRGTSISDSISNYLSRQNLSDDEDEYADDGDEDQDLADDGDEEDDSYGVRTQTSTTNLNPAKKGRNVDKACNHCKRSHLRCDNMRPCRRCVATGKTGCKDVEHKPRGRPRLHKA